MEDYLEKIPNPMSLTDIGVGKEGVQDVQNKIKDNVYESVDDMEKDVKLIMDNARAYHGAASPIAKMGSELYDVSLLRMDDGQTFMELKRKAFDLGVCQEMRWQCDGVMWCGYGYGWMGQ